MAHGFSAPYSATGRSAIVPAPPWHYAGWILSIEYELEASAAADFLPSGFGQPTGAAAVHFADWQSTSDGSELLDPIYAQYREAFVVVEAERDGALVNFCPFIYVDQDISLMRGWLQGLPKKSGSVWLTRSLPLDHPAAAPLVAGTRLGGSLAVKDRRLAEAALTLTGRSAPRLGLLKQPTYGLLGLPTLLGEAATPADPRLVRFTADPVVHGAYHDAEATLAFFASPRDELADLAPRRVTAASAGYVGLTISRVTDPT